MSEHTEAKAKLEALQATIISELADLGVHQPADGDWVATPEGVATSQADPNVVADRNEDWAERRATLSALEIRFNNIKRALNKIEAGTYGVCEISGEPIEADRLEANPAARTCKAHLNDEADLPL